MTERKAGDVALDFFLLLSPPSLDDTSCLAAWRLSAGCSVTYQSTRQGTALSYNPVAARHRMAEVDQSYFDPANHPPPGTGPGPPGVPGGTDRSYSVDIIVCACVSAVIGFAFVGMRFYTRMFILRVLNSEDWLILLALVSIILLATQIMAWCPLTSMHAQGLLDGHVWWIYPRFDSLADITVFMLLIRFFLACSLQRQLSATALMPGWSPSRTSLAWPRSVDYSKRPLLVAYPLPGSWLTISFSGRVVHDSLLPAQPLVLTSIHPASLPPDMELPLDPARGQRPPRLRHDLQGSHIRRLHDGVHPSASLLGLRAPEGVILPR